MLPKTTVAQTFLDLIGIGQCQGLDLEFNRLVVRILKAYFKNIEYLFIYYFKS